MTGWFPLAEAAILALSAIAGWFRLNVLVAHILLAAAAFMAVRWQIAALPDRGDFVLPGSVLVRLLAVYLSGAFCYWLARLVRAKLSK